MSLPSADAPVGRLAPSPTGLLHLGHARTFLLAWCSLRARGGRVLMRFDDLDEQRSRADLADAALADLHWLGLDWDGPVSRQSQQRERYAAALARLQSEQSCYACVCSRRDVQSAIAAPHSDEPRYPGTCRDRFVSLAAAREQTGKDPCLRFRVPAGEVTFLDALCGPQAFDVEAAVGDFVVARRDGTPAYQLAVVVDDAADGVSEVVRGMDLLASTARQWLLQRALHLPHPTWGHVPLVLDEQGRRLAKRADDLSLRALREAGVPSQAVVGWAARSAGFDVPRRCTVQELLPNFDLAKASREPTVLTKADLVDLIALGES